MLNSLTNPGYPLVAKLTLGGPRPKDHLAAKAVQDLLWKLIIETLPYKKLIYGNIMSLSLSVLLLLSV